MLTVGGEGGNRVEQAAKTRKSNVGWEMEEVREGGKG